MKMSDMALTFEQLMEETGFAAKWVARGKAIGEVEGEARGKAIGEAEGETRGEARGQERRSLQVAKNMLAGGFSVEQTAELTELDIEKVWALHQTAPLP
jgi:predicted transposase YdaD